MTETQYFTIKPGTLIRILGEDGQWRTAQTIGGDVSAKSSETPQSESPTPKTVFSALSEAIRTEDQDGQLAAIDAISQYFGAALAANPEELREFVGENVGRGRHHIANGLADLLHEEEGFDAERFVRHATAEQAKPRPDAQPGYEYPTSARRAFVNLSEAIRTINEPGWSRRMLEALAGIHVTDAVRDALVVRYVEHSADDRVVLSGAFADILDGTHEKFDAARFIHHATSDSDADDDGESGKWSYNRLHQAEAQKTTIESVDDDGEATETVVI